MTNQRSDSNPKQAEPAKVVRLVDAKSGRKEATPPDGGIRPTREGPWDPCRFQEYEVSPEFRQQIMSAKPPVVDPSIFMETMPPTPVAEIVPKGPRGDESQTVTFDPKEFTGNSPGTDASAVGNPVPPSAAVSPAGIQATTVEQPRTSKRKSALWIKALLVVGAVFGLAVGYAVAHYKNGGARADDAPAHLIPKIPSNMAPPVPAASTRMERTSNVNTAAAQQPSAKSLPVASNSPLDTLGKMDVKTTRAAAEPGATSSKPVQSSAKRNTGRAKGSPSDDSFPSTTDD
jgi:hypothetical protein